MKFKETHLKNTLAHFFPTKFQLLQMHCVTKCQLQLLLTGLRVLA